MSRRQDDEEHDALPPALRDAVARLRAVPEAAPGAVERATAAALAAQRASRADGRAGGRGRAVAGTGRAVWTGWRPAAWAAGVLAAAGVGAGVWSARAGDGPGAVRAVATAEQPHGPESTIPDEAPGRMPNAVRDAVPNEASSEAPHAVPYAGSDAAPAALGALDEAPRLVRFRLRAPGARGVAVVGDFNRWDRAATPLGARGSEWTVDVPLTPGRHAYAFVVDGRRWVLDPAAPAERDPDFGRTHSVTVVGLAGAP